LCDVRNGSKADFLAAPELRPLLVWQADISSNDSCSTEAACFVFEFLLNEIEAIIPTH
jgi:hypothetical protein